VPSFVFNTTRDELLNASKQFDVVPVHAVVDSISIHPIDALNSLRPQGEPAFIFESESPEAGASRYAYVCPKVEQIIRTGENESLGDTNPITVLRQHFESRTVAPVSDLPELVTGAFGYIAYEAIKHFEPSVRVLPADPTGSPSSAMLFPAELLVFDRILDRIHIIVFTTHGQTFESAETQISNICNSLESASDTARHLNNVNPSYDDQPIQPLHTTHAQLQYQHMVSEARKAIIDGELIQIVLGQRIETQTQANPIEIYKHLSTMNPSPYMYMLDLGDMQLIGASPELMLRTTNGNAAVHPIAGTRPRGTTAEEDLQFEAELLSNEKELAEHVMLVDLARNDLGRVSKPGTVNVKSFKRIERYSHVMHLVSRVVGELSDDKDGIDAFEAGFPIGTLSGAPKFRSIQLIAELEKEGRGPYCGGIGWFAPNGDVDTGTIIRSIVLRNGTGHVQGGAGIVFDSDPEAEYFESLQKAKAPLLAIARAEITAEKTQKHHCRSNENISPETPHTATITAK
jgi:anthranilate synthase component 1